MFCKRKITPIFPNYSNHAIRPQQKFMEVMYGLHKTKSIRTGNFLESHFNLEEEESLTSKNQKQKNV